MAPIKIDEVRALLAEVLDAQRAIAVAQDAHEERLDRLEAALHGVPGAHGLITEIALARQERQALAARVSAIDAPRPAEPSNAAIVIPTETAKAWTSSAVGAAKAIGPYVVIGGAWLVEHFRWIP